MVAADNGIDACIEALHALKLIWRCYGTGPQSQKHVDDIVDLLTMGTAGQHPRTPRRVFGDAIKANFGTPSSATPQGSQSGP